MAKNSLARKIAYTIMAAGIVVFYFWQRRRPDPMWFGEDKEFWYTALYLAFVLVMGVPVLIKWRRSRYFTVRTISCMVTQLLWGYLLIYFILPFDWRGVISGGELIPFTAFLQNLWPLEIYGLVVPRYFEMQPVVTGWLIYVVVTSLILMPIVAMRFGRAYCSWFCSCGNLAETAGDPFRTQAPKGRIAVLLEWMIAAFVVYSVAATIGLRFDLGNQALWQEIWGVWIKFFFAAILGIGLYPLLGSRIWCRYFCPWAGMFGALGKLGKAGISANNMCMACGMCNKQCEMGIDIRRNAMCGEVTKTTSCVYCGACVAICPRNVLRVI